MTDRILQPLTDDQRAIVRKETLRFNHRLEETGLFSDEALAIFAKKKNLRLMIAKGGIGADALQEIRSVVGGVLVQDRDRSMEKPAGWKVVTKRQPTPEEMAAMLFGWKVGKHVKSNAIVYCRGEQTLGIGAGQMEIGRAHV